MGFNSGFKGLNEKKKQQSFRILIYLQSSVTSSFWNLKILLFLAIQRLSKASSLASLFVALELRHQYA